VTTPVARLLAECAHLRPIDDPQLDALRRAVLVEEVLGVRLTDEQIDLEFLSDSGRLEELATDPAPG
jgi:hypothetical protein